MNNLIGRQLDHYRVDALVGEGGMGAVYRAYDQNLALPVALKIMHPHLANQAQFQQRFMQEAQAAARLRHPSVVNIKYFGAKQGLLFMVMDLVTGPGLGNYLRQQAPLGQMIHLSETLYVLAQVADALDYAHRQGVVHRDVKPDNVLIQPLEQPDQAGEPALRAVVTDFGLAKLLQGGIQTSTGSFMGTLPYMSPEQCMGVPLDGRSDIYSLGIMLYQLATGRLPFEVKTPVEAAEKHIREVPPDPCSIQPGLPDSVEETIQRAIAKEPENRYQQASGLASDLRRAAASLTEADITQYAAESTVVSLMTQMQGFSQTFQEPSRLGLDLDAQGSEDQLLVALKDHTPLTIHLDKAQINMGRAVENDVVLPEEGVSRRHARLERTPSGWRVVDLASTNGTYLDRQKLLPDVPEDWAPGQTLRLGPYYLHWKQGSGQGVHTGATALLSGLSGSTQVQSTSGQLGLVLNPTSLTIEPGKQAEIQVEVFHLGSTVEQFQLGVDGLPADWVTLPSGPLSLMPGENAAQRINLHPPRSSSALSGQHDYKVVVRSLSNPNETAAVPAQLELTPFEAFTVDVRPQHLSSGASSRVTISNQGNVEGVYAITGRDPADAVRFDGLRGRVKVPPGKTLTQDLVIAARKRPLLGARKTQSFEIQVHSQAGTQQGKRGELAVNPVLPWWAVSGLGVLFAFLCLGVFVAAGAFFPIDFPVLGGGGSDVEVPGVGLVPATLTATPTLGEVGGGTGGGFVGDDEPEPDQPLEPSFTVTATQTSTQTPTPTETNTPTPTATGTLAVPVAADDSAQVNEDDSTSISVVGNDSDPDGSLDMDSLSVTSGPSNGKASSNGSGSFEYTPDANYSGPDSFTYQVCDEDGLCDTAVVSLEVIPVNDAPVAEDGTENGTEDKTLNVAAPGVLGNDHDIDGDKLVASLETQAGHGTVSLQSNGSYAYVPDDNYCGTDSFTYTASDGNGGVGTAKESIKVSCKNDKPVAVKDTFQDAVEDVVYKVSAPGVLGNDIDVDKDKLTAKRMKNTRYGNLSLENNGSFTYTPNLDFCSSAGVVDTFEYQVVDEQGAASDTVVASIIVRCIVNENVHYKITVKTGDKSDAGTDAAVYIRLFGTQEVTPPVGFKLAKDGVDDHERNKTYTYDIYTNDGIGYLNYAEIWLADGNNKNTDGWYLESVVIERLSPYEKKQYTCRQWFDSNSNGNITKRRLEGGTCK